MSRLSAYDALCRYQQETQNNQNNNTPPETTSSDSSASSLFYHSLAYETYIHNTLLHHHHANNHNINNNTNSQNNNILKGIQLSQLHQQQSILTQRAAHIFHSNPHNIIHTLSNNNNANDMTDDTKNDNTVSTLWPPHTCLPPSQILDHLNIYTHYNNLDSPPTDPPINNNSPQVNDINSLYSQCRSIAQTVKASAAHPPLVPPTTSAAKPPSSSAAPSPPTSSAPSTPNPNTHGTIDSFYSSKRIKTGHEAAGSTHSTPYTHNNNDNKQSSSNSNNHNNENEEQSSWGSSFMSGSQKYLADQAKKNGGKMPSGARASPVSVDNTNNSNKSLGVNKRKFVPPYKKQQNYETEGMADMPLFILHFLCMHPDEGRLPDFVKKGLEGPEGGSTAGKPTILNGEELPERLKVCDTKMIEMIESQILDRTPNVETYVYLCTYPKIGWKDIAGLEFQKKCVQEIAVWPILKPHIFKGLRGPPKGILLFGPPGTGKTLIGKAIAAEAGAKFFSVSASALTSKWHGEGEKLVVTLFALAAHYQPSIIFVDEIDSLLSQRNESDFEAMRRLTSEFLIQLDGAHTTGNERVLIVGATNRPWALDEAARRRLVKRLYVPLPEFSARKQLVCHLLKSEHTSMTEEHINDICRRTEGYSGADMKALCTEAAFGPIRSVGDITAIQDTHFRPIEMEDFVAALGQIRPSVGTSDLERFLDWNKSFGSFPIQPAPGASTSTHANTTII